MKIWSLIPDFHNFSIGPYMYYRIMQEELKISATQLPIVTILGPRQSGKTTLVRETFPEKPYVNMESLHTRELAIRDPIAFLEQYPNGAIFE